ncbi:hypothetical protein FB45DRAFT_1110087 [Roridomyces roridus]|uniref:Uncharacterized protein n=1 Tax=Roridomyces roridus TaxID=1738132 RepID=A0AAD7B9T5_9AGAR|nr:hypothetical protein FB45DRAFT_1110087 [Roridomyces roridus]
MSSSQESAAVAAIVAEMNQLGGPMLIGVLLSSIFYGVTLLQTYIYYDKYGREDRQPLLWLVGFLTFIDLLGMILNIEALWHFFVVNFGNPLIFLTTSWTWLVPIALTVLIGSTVQCFYAWRLWKLSKRNLIAPAVVVIYRHDLIGDIYVALIQIRGDSAIPKVTWLSTTSLACALAADVIIATSMIFYLYQGSES